MTGFFRNATIITVCLFATSAAIAQDAAPLDADRVIAISPLAASGERDSRQVFRSLDETVQSVTKVVLDCDGALAPADAHRLYQGQPAVPFFISMDVGEYFALDSVNLKIDGKEVTNYLYTQREVDALIRGGVHRLHMVNLKVGDHELVAVFTGKGPNMRDYRRGATLMLNKGIGAKYVELEITDRVRKQQPEFEIREWE